MKMYVWTPDGHGQLSFFVMAESKAIAKKQVDTYIKESKQEHMGYYADGWGTSYYELEEVEPLQVYTHVND